MRASWCVVSSVASAFSKSITRTLRASASVSRRSLHPARVSRVERPHLRALLSTAHYLSRRMASTWSEGMPLIGILVGVVGVLPAERRAGPLGRHGPPLGEGEALGLGGGVRIGEPRGSLRGGAFSFGGGGSAGSVEASRLYGIWRWVIRSSSRLFVIDLTIEIEKIVYIRERQRTWEAAPGAIARFSPVLFRTITGVARAPGPWLPVDVRGDVGSDFLGREQSCRVTIEVTGQGVEVLLLKPGKARRSGAGCPRSGVPTNSSSFVGWRSRF